MLCMCVTVNSVTVCYIEIIRSVYTTGDQPPLFIKAHHIIIDCEFGTRMFEKS